MSIAVFIVLAAFFLAYSNGANDNFKGAATLAGTRTTTTRGAMLVANIATGAGAVAALAVGEALLKTFSGKGLVPDAVAAAPAFLMAVGFAAAATVLLATRLGFPISTTHALTGALVGAGLVAVQMGVSFDRLWDKFLMPLIVSPFLAFGGALVVYKIFRAVRLRLGVEAESGLFLVKRRRFVRAAPRVLAMAPTERTFEVPADLADELSIETGAEASVVERYQGRVFGVMAQQVLDVLHYISAGAVCFARGLNDTPKIAALLVTSKAIAPGYGTAIVGSAMVLGGVLSSKRVAHTMSERITEMNSGQGFTANLVTSALVIGASRFGVPVSTTHVSCGALFGIGTANGRAHWRTISHIMLAWVITLPTAGILAAGLYAVFSAW